MRFQVGKGQRRRSRRYLTTKIYDAWPMFWKTNVVIRDMKRCVLIWGHLHLVCLVVIESHDESGVGEKIDGVGYEVAMQRFEEGFLMKCVVVTEVVLVTVAGMVEDEVEIAYSAIRATEAFEGVWAKIVWLPASEKDVVVSWANDEIVEVKQMVVVEELVAVEDDTVQRVVM